MKQEPSSGKFKRFFKIRNQFANINMGVLALCGGTTSNGSEDDCGTGAFENNTRPKSEIDSTSKILILTAGKSESLPSVLSATLNTSKATIPKFAP